MAKQGPLERKLAAALRDAKLAPRDGAAIQLARRYVQLLDESRGQPSETDVYSDLGPKLLKVLTSIGLTLEGRQATVKGGAPNVGTGSAALTSLREAAAARRSAGSGSRVG